MIETRAQGPLDGDSDSRITSRSLNLALPTRSFLVEGLDNSLVNTLSTENPEHHHTRSLIFVNLGVSMSVTRCAAVAK